MMQFYSLIIACWEFHKNALWDIRPINSRGDDQEKHRIHLLE